MTGSPAGLGQVTMFSNLRERLTQPPYLSLRENLSARIAVRQISEGTELSSAVDSLDLIELEMEIEELGIEPSLPINTVGDLLWLLKAIEFQRSRKNLTSPDT